MDLKLLSGCDHLSMLFRQTDKIFGNSHFSMYVGTYVYTTNGAFEWCLSKASSVKYEECTRWLGMVRPVQVSYPFMEG